MQYVGIHRWMTRILRKKGMIIIRSGQWVYQWEELGQEGKQEDPGAPVVPAVLEFILWVMVTGCLQLFVKVCLYVLWIFLSVPDFTAKSLNDNFSAETCILHIGILTGPGAYGRKYEIAALFHDLNMTILLVICRQCNIHTIFTSVCRHRCRYRYRYRCT